MRTYSYSETHTRTEAVQDQFDIFLQYAGIGEEIRTKLLIGIERKALEAVGVYLVDNGGKRILEVAVEVDWRRHADLAAISPHISTDLPGWESGAAPEIRTLGHRFGRKAKEYGQKPGYWGRFIQSIRDDEKLHRQWCPTVGLGYESKIPTWRNDPVRRENMALLDLEEVNIGISEA